MSHGLHEQSQRFLKESLDQLEIDDERRQLLCIPFREVKIELPLRCHDGQVSYRMAAYLIAVQRVSHAIDLRGF